MKFDDPRQQERLEEYYQREEEDLVQVLAKRYGIPYADLSLVSINTNALTLIDEETAKDAGIVAFDAVSRKVKVAIISPNKQKTKEVIEGLKREGYEVSVYMASQRSLDKAINLYKEAGDTEAVTGGVFDVSPKEVERVRDRVKDVAGLKEEIDGLLSAGKHGNVSRILEVLLGSAISLKASDIHLEPEDEQVRMRLRLDGVLRDTTTFSHGVYRLLLSRIKLLSGLKLNIKTIAQDGRFSIQIGESDIEIRTSILPGNYGESVVMRVLNPDAIGVSFEQLGIEDHLFSVLEKEIKRPNGLILTSGPTGSGKTTTLYAILKKVHTPDIKIITIEDPIEYHLQGITQTQTQKDKGYTFASGLRSSLRQDPDIIMVGEIRDKETAQTALNASLTGHLVFSTIHTNSAAGVIPRFIDLGINPKIIGSAINLALAQRLVRRLCSSCKKQTTLSEKEQQQVDRLLERIKTKRPNVTLPELSFWEAGEGSDCSECGGVGYKGRIGIYEGVLVDEQIEKIIMEGNPSTVEVTRAAQNQGLLTMSEDGVMKALQGTTSISELKRVIDLDE